MNAMTMLGNGLHDVGHDEDALLVREAELSMDRRLGAPEEDMLIAQGNIACTYENLRRDECALRVRQEVYSGRVRLNGEEQRETLVAAYNYAVSLNHLERFEEAKAVLRNMMPVAPRVLGENHELMLRTRALYAEALYLDEGATLGDLREAATAFEDVVRISRRVLGGSHPVTTEVENDLQKAQAALYARGLP